ncbi:MAG: HlyC/CorC family transporter [Acidimicrobiia bacterium]|nr:HlyC/CorC family transporter [Acidimicrobiia bacterium]
MIFGSTATTTDVVMIGVIVVLLVITAFLALAETGLTRMSRAKAVGLEESGRKGGLAVLRLVTRPEEFLNPLLLVILVVQSIQTALTTLVSERLFGGAGVVVGLFFNILIVFVLCEAAPKTWAVQHSESSALATARPVYTITRFWPLRMVSRMLIGLTNVILPGKGLKQGPFVSEEELLAVADEARESETIDASEAALIKEIIDFGDTIVREVMVPRTDMISVQSDFRVADVMEIVLLNGYSRVPVSGEGIDDIVGVAYAKDLMRAERDDQESAEVAKYMRLAHFVPETKRVADLLREMQGEKFHMAIVIDEYGGTSGLVTLEDLIEELVGEIVDEYDVEDPRVEPLPGGDVRVDGRLSIDEANEVLGGELPEGDWDTVGGLLFSTLGKVAVEGDEVDVDGYRLRADKIQGRRITRVRISQRASS